MCSSPRSPNSRPDPADRACTVIGLAVLLAGILPLLAWEWTGPRSGEVELFPETALRLALAPVPAVAAPPPEPPALEPPPPASEPEPAAPPESAPAPGPAPESAPPEIPPAPSEAEQPPVETPGDAGREEAIQEQWFGELRRRIEENKFYPGGARFSKETGTVTLRVRISAGAEIIGSEVVSNTGSGRLAEGAQAILRRAAASPLGTNRLAAEIQAQVPITYRMTGR
ncbi:MAG TPA: TonB family protein [Kiritimatiellia bacterium]|nr:TonB family protein [Kiritimatiellia bacterium]HRZ10972.1 TonB family protein [Kiritimatiellia bacterium]HSA18545.1 TonB family protein [Kiritimatiellia bacterium]